MRESFLGLVLDLLGLHGLRWRHWDGLARTISFMMGRKDLCLCEWHFCAPPDDTFMMLGWGWVGERIWSTLTCSRCLWTGTPFVELLFHFAVESTLRVACSEILLVCQVNAEETGKQAVFSVLWHTEDKILEKDKDSIVCWTEHEDQEVWVPVVDGALIMWPWYHAALRSLLILEASCARPVIPRKTFTCTITVIKESNIGKNYNGLFKIKDTYRNYDRKKSVRKLPVLLIMFTQGRKETVRHSKFG